MNKKTAAIATGITTTVVLVIAISAYTARKVSKMVEKLLAEAATAAADIPPAVEPQPAAESVVA